MIKTLRRKFIFIMMSMVSLLLITIFMTVIVATSSSIQEENINKLRQILQTGVVQDYYGNAVDARSRMNVIVVELYADGSYYVATNQFLLLDDNLLSDIVKQAAKSQSDSGELRQYDLRFLKHQTSNTLRIAFADTSMERSIIRSLALVCILICTMSLLAFFILSVFLAGWAVRPVENAWMRQKRFVADASHELKTPLTVILSNAEMLHNSGLQPDSKAAERVDNILAEGIRMKKLIENMLSLAKSDYAENALILSKVNLSDIILDSVLLYESAAYDDKKQLFYNVEEGIIVNGDADKLRQVIDILLDNALKYSKEGASITVSLTSQFSIHYRKEAKLVVRNEGEPIPKNELENIFIRFYRVDKARENHGGFGLGLSIAQEIIQSHKGRIWADSDSTGNVFSVTLPLASSYF
ncbi:MAG TPA: ATP-binding protein [Clostridiales bacterium]|nr:ATP-binding protein [Clostridiales bacterium]HQA06246.1 ATP-binding protein [Clostridiales bacterium]